LSELNVQKKKVEKEVLELKKLDVIDSVLLQKSHETERNVSSLENQLRVGCCGTDFRAAPPKDLGARRRYNG
jgi:hypothetical protein